MTTTEPYALHYIQRAHTVLDTERTRTTTERDAFRQFHARFTQIEPTTPPSAMAADQSGFCIATLAGFNSAATTFVQAGKYLC